MRYMSIVTSPQPMTGPTPALMEAMGKLAEREIKAGRMIDMGGLMPLQQGARVSIEGGKLRVTDGPFVEAKEVIGGFAILNYASHEQAIEGARRVMQIHAEHGCTDLEMELRPMMDPGECGAQVPQQQASAA